MIRNNLNHTININWKIIKLTVENNLPIILAFINDYTTKFLYENYSLKN